MSLVFSFLAFLAAGIALLFNKMQVQLAEKQLEIIEKQDEIIGRQARLEFTARVRPKGLDMAVPAGSVRVEFRITNTGSRGARDYYWHVYLPRVWPYEWEGGVVEPTHKDRIYRLGGQWFKYFAGYVDRPLHPRRASTIGSMQIPVKGFPFQMEWQVTCDDGSFPGAVPGKLEVRLEDHDDDALQSESEA